MKEICRRILAAFAAGYILFLGHSGNIRCRRQFHPSLSLIPELPAAAPELKGFHCLMQKNLLQKSNKSITEPFLKFNI